MEIKSAQLEKVKSVDCLESLLKQLTNNNYPKQIFTGSARNILQNSIDIILTKHSGIGHYDWQKSINEILKSENNFNIDTQNYSININKVNKIISLFGKNNWNLNFFITLESSDKELKIINNSEFLRTIDENTNQLAISSIIESFTDDHVSKTENCNFILPESYLSASVFNKLWCSVAESSVRHAVDSKITKAKMEELKRGLPLAHSEQNMSGTASYDSTKEELFITQSGNSSFIIKSYKLGIDSKTQKECVQYSKTEFTQLEKESQFVGNPKQPE